MNSSQILEVNRRKIYKWIFMLLEEQHKRLGLKVLCHSCPPGINNPCFTFYFDSIRTESGLVITQFPVSGNTLHSMTMYQHTVGMPAWATGPQVEHPMQTQQELRTHSVMPWLKQTLKIIECGQVMSGRIEPDLQKRPHWDISCERYLLSWKMLGHYMASLPEFQPLETVGGSEPMFNPPYIRDAKRFLPVTFDDILVFAQGIHADDLKYWLHTGCIYRAGGECIDFYQMIKGGKTFETVLARVTSFMNHKPKSLKKSLDD